jgi:signal transduction histidine kinase
VGNVIGEVAGPQRSELRPQAIEEVDRSTPGIEAGGAQLQEVILNLVPKAIDAMADVDGRARAITVSSNFVDGYASVAIADTGVGVPQSSERVFGALYTTMDGGLGLRLSICRKVINAHGGQLWMEKNPNPGVTFAFAVPLRQLAQRLNGN